ncbi:PREDICTED: uncharacterized protein LOC109205536 [Nicotiana attenuata]|uniref:Uncharacterized protein n=1 Tax=Nicotiana attenuata TaxID=49451 RepID=A0A314KX57_NICAT|nr:PREDICTED: uncharacterized protein LOC109205536 [Nicotiana attenuata]OIT33802.1 hypothetical protein A4A49_17479 [Nicotiana attenuata]
MAYYIEEEVWKCPKHPSKKRRPGVCSICLRNRLSKLCPHCANVRPCSCRSSGAGVGCDSEPALCRSKSVGIPFVKSRDSNTSDRRNPPASEKSTKTASFWWIFKSRKRTREAEGKENEFELKEKSTAENKYYYNTTGIKELSRMMMIRSRSANVDLTSVPGGNDVMSPGKLKGWYLLSPMKVFRQSKFVQR